MKCPKCHYLSFEPEPRCRNCGFSFSLADGGDALIRGPEPSGGPFADLDLHPPAQEPRGTASRTPVAPPPIVDSPRTAIEQASAKLEKPEAAGGAAAVSGPRPASTTELPLFVKAMTAPAPDAAGEHEVPLVKMRDEPRPPLTVRRKSVDGRSRSIPAPGDKKLGPFDRDLLEDLQRMEQQDHEVPLVSGPPRVGTSLPERAGARARAVAAGIDATLLGTTAAAVLWVTLRWCDLSFSSVAVLPLLPTAGFLLLVGAGYLLMFTAFGGQTLGKMAVGIRVINASDTASPPSVGQAAYRALLTLPSVLVFGLGFLPALMGEERALHDRLAQTRVVRA